MRKIIIYTLFHSILIPLYSCDPAKKLDAILESSYQEMETKRNWIQQEIREINAILAETKRKIFEGVPAQQLRPKFKEALNRREKAISTLSDLTIQLNTTKDFMNTIKNSQ